MDRIIEKVHFDMPVQPKATRVAAYACVSSGKDAMLHSLSAQISYYSEMIQSHPGWLYTGVYSDEALTGTKENRCGFQALLEDCRAGKIDKVIVKSISRLARNTVTLLETVRELRTYSVDVYFEEQNIHTLSSEGELMLTILASYAQEESLSVSENQKWRIQKNFKEGKPWNGAMLGYRNVNGTLTVIPEEAELVKRIFDMYLSGMGIQSIANTLNREGVPTRLGVKFKYTGIHKMLRNEAYAGNLLLQKTFKDNHITKRTIINHGELPMYYVENAHEPIIPPETFRRVQEMIAQRAEKYAPPATKTSTHRMLGSTAKKRRVAGYARVSTDKDERYTSYEAQVDYYTQFIRRHADWEFVKVYTDEGISGLGTRKRDGFNEMIEDAMSGIIDLIITKLVSRFARNTVDSLVTIRKLKDKGVEVYFEKENIYSLDGKGELLLTIMSSLAQEESRSISENVT